MLDGYTETLGVIGDPISHSLSPVMHNEAIAHKKMNYCYLPFLVKQEALKAAVEGIKSLNIKGVNVTTPHKEEIMAYLDEISDEASEIGAVNTVVNKEDKLIGYNTDGEGFIESIKEKGFSPEGKVVALIGVGGATRSVSYSLAKHGVDKLLLINRTYYKAKELKEELLNNPKLVTENIEACELGLSSLEGKLEEVDILINGLPTEPVLNDDRWAIPLTELKNEGLAVDFRYHPKETSFLAQCKKEGMSTMNGLFMLLYQGVIAFEIFTGERAPVEVMKEALIANT